MPELLLTTSIVAPADSCFDLALSVDAHTGSMQASGERVVAGVRTGSMSLGESVTWQARHFGVPFRMTSEITEYERPTRFVDEQTGGPFAMWWHEHRFDEVDGVTTMSDLVRYRSPAGSLGRLVDRLFLERYLRDLLAGRNAWLKRALE